MSGSEAISQKEFGVMPNGDLITEYLLINKQGTRIKVINLGGIITEIWTLDKYGKFHNIVLGFSELEPYWLNGPYFGALIGRVANRIANARFSLLDEHYHLNSNDGPNSLHSGPGGFEKKIWTAKPFENDLGPGLELSLISEDGDQGFPGTVSVKVIYQLTHDNEWRIEFFATTDKSTPINLTHHSYFNLAGRGDVLNHRLQLFADHITPVDDVRIPLGNLMPVADTPFDFRQAHLMGERIEQDDVQLKIGRGYDHNFVIRQSGSDAISYAARVEEDSSGRVLELFTQAPGVQFYTGNWLDGTLKNQDKIFHARTGFCLEPQHFPDSPNQPQFPSIILHPGEEHKSLSIFRFSVKK